ncbi:hypothetical protein Lal_00010184 [Lupinus albus]|uniref:Uncharacterized protein n=1 Tax=Lupinus albus TaxID=3870 RepID=A0A6A5LIZ8_LUPAL|nr:hypothetical protein Lalb_Chr24g0397021 [Lupinus albus]KAF1859600.1 hypothetical protein Lal_00010184 [Lupinus albus]
MAQINSNISRVVFFIVFIVGFVLAAEARSQISDEFSQAPAPSPDVGAGFLVTYFGALLCSSLFLSLLVLISH